MKKFLCLFIACLFMSACGSKPVPVWIAAGHEHLQTFKEDFLTGRSPRITEMHFQKAIEEIKKGGDLDLLGKAWLTRMALQVAVLEEIEAGEYPKVEAALSVPANRNFHLFLIGSLDAVDGAFLQEQYRPSLRALRGGNAAEVDASIARIADPLSRLIAAGVAERRRLENDMIIATAVETASQNGWKRALLAWLKREQKFYEAVGDEKKAAVIRDRIGIIGR